MILIVPIADWLAVIYYNIDCNHCRPDGWNVLSRLQTEWPAVIVTIANWKADIYCTHCRLDGHSLWGDTKLGLQVWIWMVYISSGVIFLGDSESEEMVLVASLQAPLQPNALGEGHVICFGTDDIYMTGCEISRRAWIWWGFILYLDCSTCYSQNGLGHRGEGQVTCFKSDYLFTIGCEIFKKGINMKRAPSYHVYCPCNSHYGHYCQK